MKGITTRRNKNNFYVVQVHYTADPEKDPLTEKGKRWYLEARKGMPEASWAREYEIDWFARSGQQVYPGFDLSVHVIDPFLVPPGWSRGRLSRSMTCRKKDS